MKFSIYYIPYISLILLLGSGCRKKATVEPAAEKHEVAENTVELTNAQYKNAGIETGAVGWRQISGTVKVNGVLDVPPQQMVSISLPLGGFLQQTELLQGMRVKKGQVIAIVENPEFIRVQQQYVEAESQLELAKAEYERQEILARENVSAQKTLQQAKANYTSLEARYHGLTAQLKLLKMNPASLKKGEFSAAIPVYAPISGYVTKVNANIGKYLNPTDVLFEIVDTEHLHAELTVFEKDIRYIQIGQKVRLTLASEQKERTATVYLIGRDIAPDRTVRIHCHLDQEDADLLPGMYLKAYIETGGAEVTSLPDEAIINYQGTSYIFVEAPHGDHAHDHEDHGTEAHGENYLFNMVAVNVGNSEDGYTEVIFPEGFDTKDASIVIKGAYNLLSQVKISEEEGGHAH